MAHIRPFCGWRYTPEIPLDDVASPPYDVISPSERATLAARHPYNVVHLTLPQPHLEAGLSAYDSAAHTLRLWQDQGMLQQDPTPALYLLRQNFHLPDGRATERRGCIAQLRLAPWGQGILPHERTFPQAKADRLALLKATGLHDSPIFTLFQDDDGAVRQRLAFGQARPPDATYRDDRDDRHDLWRLSEPDLIADLTRLLAERTLYVADGHHRYETALAYQVWRREQTGDASSDQPHDFCLAYFAAMEDPGTVILPTHRLVTHGRRIDFDPLLQALALDFDLLPFADDKALISVLDRCLPGEPVFGLILDAQAPYLLRLRPHSAQRQVLLAAHPAEVAATPVAILQTLVLGPYFGVSVDPQTQKAQLQFEPNAAIAADHVRRGRALAALLTTPTSIAQLQTLADAGHVTPPKATYFYPKLPSGLVFSQAGPHTTP